MHRRRILTQFICRKCGVYPMSAPVRTTVKCQDPGDSSGDVIIDFLPDVLAAMTVDLGDLLTIELVDGSIVPRPIRDADAKS
jgi:antitoxin ChpS